MAKGIGNPKEKDGAIICTRQKDTGDKQVIIPTIKTEEEKQC